MTDYDKIIALTLDNSPKTEVRKALPKMGKVYFRHSYLIEIDHDTGITRTVDWCMFPAKENDFLLKRYKARGTKKPKKQVNEEIKNITKEEKLF